MAGTLTNPKRVRFEANERFDTSDADAQSRAPQEMLDKFARALVSAPRAAGGAQPPGMILQGFELTLNPTTGTDGKVRINATPAGVAVDSDGRFVVKLSGSSFDVTIPAGSNQIYAHWQEDVAGDLAKRRFLSVSTPYTESTRTIETTYIGSVGFHVRSGNNTNFVAEDTVNGKTTALCAIGVVTNTGGVITCTGYNATTAPNGSDITNRLATAVAPTTAPTVNTRNGSIVSITDMLAGLAHQIGQIAWKGSAGLTPAAANNFGAWNVPAGGVDAAYRGLPGFFTIGNGTTVIGDFNTSDFARADLLFTALVAALPAGGGYVYIKRGVNLSNWNGAAFALPAGKVVEIVGDHNDVPNASPQITFAANEFFDCSTTGRLVLRNLHVQYVTRAVRFNACQLHVRDCFFNKPTAAAHTGAALESTSTGELYVDNVQFLANINVATQNPIGISVAGQARRVRISRIRGYGAGTDCGLINITDVREDVVFEDIRFDVTGSFAGGLFPGILNLASTDNVTDVRGRLIRGVFSTSTALVGVRTESLGYVDIEDVHVAHIGMLSSAYAGSGPVTVRRMRTNAIQLTGTWPELRFVDCLFFGAGSTIGGASAQGVVEFIRCRVNQTGTGFAGCPMAITATTMVRLLVDGCEFDGIGSTTSADTACMKVTATTSINQAIFHRNVVNDFMNKAWAGSNVTFRIFEVNSDQVYLAECVNNVCRNIMGNGSGSARGCAYLLECNSGDRSTTDATFTAINIKNNTLGGYQGSPSYVMILNCLNFTTIDQFDISDNQVSTTWNTTAGTPLLTNMCDFTTGAAQTFCRSGYKFHDNKIDIRADSSMTNMTMNILKVQDVGGTSNCTIGSWQGNTIHFDSSAPTFDLVTGFGVNIISQTHFNLAVKGNITSYLLGALSTFFRFRFTGAVTNTLPSGGIPVSGTQISENINWVSLTT